MFNRLHQIRRWAGVDRPVFFVVLARGWSLFSGPITVVLLGTFLSPESQGYYFTFGSVMALQVFLELGFAQAIIQFASHEFAQLRWAGDGTVTGHLPARSRLLSLGRLSLKAYAVMATLAPLLVGVAGQIFFQSRAQTGVNWLLPWWLLCLGSGANLLLLPVWSLLEGCNQVEFVARCRLTMGIAGNIALWLALTLRAGLFAASASTGIAFLMGAYLLWRYRAPLLKQVVQEKLTERMSWRREIWPFHWRMAVSGISGSISSNLFNPTIFYFHGAIVAGQMGMTLSIVNSISAVAMSWMSTKAPRYGILISQRRYVELDALAWRATAQAFFVCLSGICVMLCGLVWLKSGFVLGQRFATIPAAVFLSGTALISQVVYGQAYYLRAHKKEPFMWVSLMGSGLGAVAVIVGARLFGPVGTSAAYLLAGVLVLPVTTWIFYKKRHLWHQESPAGIAGCQADPV